MKRIISIRSRHHRAAVTLSTLALIAAAIVLVIIIALSVAAGIGYWMWTSQPDYWQARQTQLAATTPEDMRTQAEELEMRISTLVTSIRRPSAAPTTATDAAAGRAPSSSTPDIRTVEMTFDEANAWLATRLESWLAHQGRTLPSQVSQFMLAPEGDNLVLAFFVQTREMQQVVSVPFHIESLQTGQARLHVEEIRGGTLPLPAETLIAQLQQQAPANLPSAELARFASALDGETFDPTFKIDNHRQARLINLNVDDNTITATIRIDPN